MSKPTGASTRPWPRDARGARGGCGSSGFSSRRLPSALLSSACPTAAASPRRATTLPTELEGEPRVEKSNGMPVITSEKRCISQPIARKTNPDNPPGRENRSSWPIARATSAPMHAWTTTPPPPNARRPTRRPSGVAAPGGCAGSTQKPIYWAAPALPAASAAPALDVVGGQGSRPRGPRRTSTTAPSRGAPHPAAALDPLGFSPPQNRHSGAFSLLLHQTPS